MIVEENNYILTLLLLAPHFGEKINEPFRLEKTRNLAHEFFMTIKLAYKPLYVKFFVLSRRNFKFFP